MSLSYRYFDPVEDHYRYVNELGKQQQLDDAVITEMYDLKHDALERISKVIHPECEKDFTKLLCDSVNEDNEFAKSLAWTLGLKQIHFVALNEDEKSMREYLQKRLFDDIGQEQELDMYI